MTRGSERGTAISRAHSSGTPVEAERARGDRGELGVEVVRRGEDAADDVLRLRARCAAMISCISSVVASRIVCGVVALDADGAAQGEQSHAARFCQSAAARSAELALLEQAPCAPARQAVQRAAGRSARAAAPAPDGRRPRTCAAPGGCGPRGSSARLVLAERAAHARRRGRAVLELDAVAQAARAPRSPIGRPPSRRAVGLRDLEARVGQPVGELAVVGQQDQPAAVGVEAPDRIQAQPRRGDELERPSGARACRARSRRRRAACSARSVTRALGAAPPRARRRSRRCPAPTSRAGSVTTRRRRSRALRDQRLGRAPRGDAGVGEVLGEAHQRLARRSRGPSCGATARAKGSSAATITRTRGARASRMPRDRADPATRTPWTSSCSRRRSPTTASRAFARARSGRGRRAARAAIEEMTDLPAALRETLERELPFSSLTLRDEARASDGTVKALFATADGRALEAVLMRYRDGRRSICVSSQSGCPLTCTFCATGTDEVRAQPDGVGDHRPGAALPPLERRRSVDQLRVHGHGRADAEPRRRARRVRAAARPRHRPPPHGDLDGRLDPRDRTTRRAGHAAAPGALAARRRRRAALAS